MNVEISALQKVVNDLLTMLEQQVQNLDTCKSPQLSYREILTAVNKITLVIAQINKMVLNQKPEYPLDASDMEILQNYIKGLNSTPSKH